MARTRRWATTLIGAVGLSVLHRLTPVDADRQPVRLVRHFLRVNDLPITEHDRPLHRIWSVRQIRRTATEQDEPKPE